MRMLLFLILINSFLRNVEGYSCEQGQCYCFDNRIMCIDMTGPKFRYRVNINFLYMDQVQILDFESIIRNLSNLEHLTLMNMRYFRCDWLNGIPSEINLHTNMCASYPTTLYVSTARSYPRTEYSTTSYWSSTGEYFNINKKMFEIVILFYPYTSFVCLFKNILLYFFIVYLERKDITKTSSSKTNDEHSPTITSTKETSETRDDGFPSTTFRSKKLTDPSLISNSDITLDPIITTMSDRNEKHIQSKSGYLFWNIILLTSSCVILILITVIGWICVRCIIKRRGSAESRMNSISNEEIEMTSVFNEHFQETSFDGGR